MSAQQLHVYWRFELNCFQPPQFFHTACRRKELTRYFCPTVSYFLSHYDTELRQTVEGDFRHALHEK